VVKLILCSESIIIEIMTVMNCILCKELIIVIIDESYYLIHWNLLLCMYS